MKKRNSAMRDLERNMLVVIALLVTLGTFAEFLGGAWDVGSHLANAPEFFWSPPHVVVYFGVSMVALGSVLGAFRIIRKSDDARTLAVLAVLLLGAAMQLAGGQADFISHEMFGIDGVVSPSHIVIEAGLVLSSVTGFLLISRTGYSVYRHLVAFSVIVVFVSVAWMMVNLALLISPVTVCMAVYAFFGEGCAVL